MTPNTDTIVPQLRQKFETLLDYVSGPASANQDLYSVEVYLFRQLLALGGLLQRQFVRTRAAVRPEAPTTPDGAPIKKNDLDYFLTLGWTF